MAICILLGISLLFTLACFVVSKLWNNNEHKYIKGGIMFGFKKKSIAIKKVKVSDTEETKAYEYACLFKTGTYDRFYIVSELHPCNVSELHHSFIFCVYVLPKNEEEFDTENFNLLNKNAVMVYGKKYGDEEKFYGWLHERKWQDDFYKLVEQTKKKKITQDNKLRADVLAKKESERQRVRKILSNY